MFKVIQIYGDALNQIAGNPCLSSEGNADTAQEALDEAKSYLSKAKDEWREYFECLEIPDIPRV